MDEHERRRRLVFACQDLARKLWHLRSRIRAAAAYFEPLVAEQPLLAAALSRAWRHLDQLVVAAYDVAASPWPGKIPCPHCGAPPELLAMSQRRAADGTRHGTDCVAVHVHYDGKECEEPHAR